MTDTPRTLVVFRKWPKTEGGGVIALFPYLPGTSDAGTCDSFQHVGGHGAADPIGLVGRTKAATPAEYAALKAELEADPYGYTLEVRSRIPSDALAVRRAAIAAQDARADVAQVDEVFAEVQALGLTRPYYGLPIAELQVVYPRLTRPQADLLYRKIHAHIHGIHPADVIVDASAALASAPIPAADTAGEDDDRVSIFAGLPDPDGQNSDRAGWAQVGLEAFADEVGLDLDPEADGPDTAIGDLIVDLAHYCQREGLSLGDIIARASRMYAEETGGKGTQFQALAVK